MEMFRSRIQGFRATTKISNYFLRKSLDGHCTAKQTLLKVSHKRFIFVQLILEKKTGQEIQRLRSKR